MSANTAGRDEKGEVRCVFLLPLSCSAQSIWASFAVSAAAEAAAKAGLLAILSLGAYLHTTLATFHPSLISSSARRAHVSADGPLCPGQHTVRRA